MRLHKLFESESNTIVFEFGDVQLRAELISMNENSITVAIVDQHQEHLAESREIVNEILPLAIGAVGLGLSAYDTYRNYRQYQRGEITGQQLAARVGTDAALQLTGGALAKGAARAWRGAKRAFQGTANQAVGTAGGQAVSQTAQAAGIDGAQVAARNRAARAASDTPPAARPTNTASQRAGGRMRRGAIGGAGGSGSMSAYNNPLQRALGRVSSFENVEVLTVPVIAGVNLDRIIESDQKFWIYKVW